MKIKYPTIDDLIFINKRIIETTKVTKAEKHGLLVNVKVLENIIKEVEITKGDIYIRNTTGL